MTYKYDVSVIIPVYNAQDYVEACVKSVMNQTYDSTKIEVILINDGSLDDSDNVCRQLQKQYPQIAYILKENSGVSDTRNTGIKIAQGKYIMMLDSDDYLSCDSIKNLITFFEEHYEEIELVTYPIYLDHNNGSKVLYDRYSAKNYDKGTGVYDLDEYPYLNQSTVNIVFKNRFEDNLLYDTSMKLSEDQNYDTELLMRTHKMGFVKEAIYYYRRYGGGVSQTKNNPYYCFDDIMSYNEGLLNKYENDGKVPKYVQNLVVNTFTWRIKKDELYPYYLEDEEFEAAKNRISNILRKIDNDVIVQYSSGDIYIKMFLLKLRGEKLSVIFDNEKYFIVDSNKDTIVEEKSISLNLYRNRIRDGKIAMFAAFVSPVFEVIPLTKYYVEIVKKDGTVVVEEKDIKASNVPHRSAKMRIAAEYPFEYTFNPEEVKEIRFFIKLQENVFDTTAVYFKYCGFVKKYSRNGIKLGEYLLLCKNSYFVIDKRNALQETIEEVRNLKQYPKKERLGIAMYRSLARGNKNVWLYYDSPGVIDNGYYQFIHDFDKNDGVERYYVVDGDTSFLKGKLTAEQEKCIVKHKSKQHKQLFLQAKKILASFISVSIYSPFRNLTWYSDLLQYELVYLQHGVLHASLQTMYAKQYTEIDKFVISSKFEFDNLINNYDYAPDDFILSGMPRMGIEEKTSEVKNKILFAPSWRQYLIGLLINNKRTLLDSVFLNSGYFREINDFLHSEELQKLLEDSNMELEFKLHPIFKEYRKHFNVEDVPHVTINFDKIVLADYKVFITDFSSYQFDFVKYVRPILCIWRIVFNK